jgi:hypothetical protein
MGLKDFVVTPLIFVIILVGAYMLRPYFTSNQTKKYFLPALILRLACAILIGVLYQFYYNGGDTFNYHSRGSIVLADAIISDTETGLRILFSDGEVQPGFQKYTTRIAFYRDSSALTLVKLAAVIDLFTFSTYSATALIFALFCFSGSWALYNVFITEYPRFSRGFALAILFIPSVMFWTSGILKDTITMGCLGWSSFLFYQIFIQKKYNLFYLIFLILNLYIIYQVKIYVLLCLIPALVIWKVWSSLSQIKNVVIRGLILPVILGGCYLILIVLFSVIQEGDERYALQNLANTAQVTAYDIAYYSGKDAGSTYELNPLDGSFQSLISNFPAAVNVSFFRPYLWEVKNPLMLLASIEATIVLLLFIIILYRIIFQPNKFYPIKGIIVFCLIFSISFAFAVGVSTFNFGTLIRYKAPMYPFFVAAMIFFNKRKDPYDEVDHL